MKKPMKPFTGVLATPVASRQLGGLLPQDEIDKRIAAFVEEDNQKLDALAKHYSIPDAPYRYYLLALELARQFVPGFTEERKRGRKSKWTLCSKGVLSVEIERLLEKDPTKSIAWAADQLAKREPWRSFIESKESGATSADPGEALRTTYFSFRSSPFAQIFRDAFKYHEATDDIAGWESEIPGHVGNCEK